MAIDPNNINTVRVGQLGDAAFSNTDLIPHEVGTELKRGSIQDLSDFIALQIGTGSSIAFRAVTVPDGGTLPSTTQEEWILVGKGTFYNVEGGDTLVCAEELNALMSNGSYWTIGVEIPINADLIGISQTILSGNTQTAPSENAVFNALAEKANLDDIPSSFNSDDIINNSGVEGATVTDALNSLDSEIPLVSDFNKSYIAEYTTGSIRNSEGDVLVLNDGRYFAAYSHFSKVSTDFGPSNIVGKISTDSTGKSWESEILISKNIGTVNVLSVSLLRISAGSIACFFLVRNSFTDLELYKTLSSDEGATWSVPVKITNNGYTDVLNSSVKKVNSGRILIATESTADGSIASPVWDIYCYKSDDNGVTFTKSNIVHFATAQGETAVCWQGGNNVLLTSRSTDGFQWFSKSTDNGTTFGTPFKSTLKSVSAPAQIINYSGTLIALHNPNTLEDKRCPLTISKSVDGSTTWVEIANINLARPNYYSYAYPSITLNGTDLLISYYEISGDGGQGLQFTKINATDLLNGIIPTSLSPSNLLLTGLTFNKAEIIQPQDDVTKAFGKIQAQINKKEGSAFKFVGAGPGVIMQNDRPDNSMQSVFMSFLNTNGSVVSNIGHAGAAQDLSIYSTKTISIEGPLLKVLSDVDVSGIGHFTKAGYQGLFEGSDQGAVDILKTGGPRFRFSVDAGGLGFYSFTSGKEPIKIDPTTDSVKMASLAGTGTRQVVADASGNLSATSLQPLKYVATLTDGLGTSIMTNNIGSIVWGVTSAGITVGTLSGAFTPDKTSVIFTPLGFSSGQPWTYSVNITSNTVTIYGQSSGTPTTSILDGIVTIEVYP